GPADVHHTSLRSDLPAHQLERLRDGDHILHARRNLQRLNFMPAPASHRSHNRALHPASDVRLVARLANALDDVRNLLLRRFLRHIDDHWLSPKVTTEFSSFATEALR